MHLTIAGVLDNAALQAVRLELDQLQFVDGRATAGWNARLVKRNMQAEPSAVLRALQERVSETLMQNSVFQLAVRAKRISALLFAKYGTGNEYGSHVDDALMSGMRTDVSFTLFLNEPEDYEGGELVIETSAGEEEVKLPAGSLYVYPANTLHRVAGVRFGERIVCVGWARSFVRSAEQRELLFDLDTARRMLFEREGKTAEFDLLSKCTANLLRRWVED